MPSTATSAKALLREAARRDRFMGAVEEAARGLFDRQRAAYNSTAKRIVLKAGRRSGKTQTALPIALRAAAKFPGAVVPVFERTLGCAAAQAFWKALISFDAQHKLGIEFRHTVKEAIMPNRARVQLFGVDTLELADKARGEPYPVAIADELGTFRSFVAQYLVEEVLTASMIDYDGSIVLIGTPGPRKDIADYWYRVNHNVGEDGTPMMHGWEQHHWTLLDNPELGKQEYQRSREWREEYLKQLIFQNGWADPKYVDLPAANVINLCDHPKFRRELMGEWVDNFGDRVYEFKPGLNSLPQLPPTTVQRPWRYGLSIDLGFNDPTAFVVTATRERDPNIYVVESLERPHLIPSSIATQIERMQLHYGRFRFIVADTGGGGKMAVEEMNTKFGLGIIAANKTSKLVYIDHLNGEFLTGRLQIVRPTNHELMNDLSVLPWNDKRTDVDERYDDHLPDALLYGFRQWNVMRAGLGEFDPPSPGSAEWFRRMEELEEQHADELSAKDGKRAQPGDEWPDESFWTQSA